MEEYPGEYPLVIFPVPSLPALEKVNRQKSVIQKSQPQHNGSKKRKTKDKKIQETAVQKKEEQHIKWNTNSCNINQKKIMYPIGGLG